MDVVFTGGRIAQARKAKGLTQQQLAEHLMVTDKAVSKWERGLNYSDIALLKPLTECLDLSISQLICGEEAPADQAAQTMNEIALRERKGLKRRLQARSWLTLAICLLMAAAQVGASYLFHRAGMYGLPQVLTGGTVGFLGVIAGNAIFSLISMRKR